MAVPAGKFPHTNTFAREKKGSFLVFNGKNQLTRLQFKDMEKCCNHQLEDYSIFRDDQNHDQNQDQVHDVENSFFLLRKKGRRKKKRTQEEERERRLRDMPTRYV